MKSHSLSKLAITGLAVSALTGRGLALVKDTVLAMNRVPAGLTRAADEPVQKGTPP